MNRFLAAGILTLLSVPAAAQNWPAFRGPGSTGVAGGTNIPHNWNVEDGTNILWKTEIPGYGHSSPIVWGDKMFVTAAVTSGESKVDPRAQALSVKEESEFEWRLYALDKHSGEILWQRTARKGIPRGGRHPQSSHASATPVTNGNVVVTWFGSEGLYAYDLDGNLLWERTIGRIRTTLFFDPDQEYGTASSPVIYRNMVIIQADKDKGSFIAAFSLADGSEVWRTARDEFPSWSTPIIVEGGKRDELVTIAHKFTRSYDPATGKELWRFGHNGEQHIPSPVLAGGVLYFTSIGEISPVYAIRPGASGDISLKDGEPRSEHIAWYNRRGGVHVVSPLVYRGHMYICSDNGVISVFDAASGKRVYRARLGGRGGSYMASPIGVNGDVLFFNQEGDAFFIKAGPKYELVSENSMDELIMATPAISGGVLFVRGYKHVFAIGEGGDK